MTTKINGNQIQLGDDADTSKNFIISVPATPDGTLSIARESGTAVLSITANGDVILTGKLSQAAQSSVSVNTANGYGSTATVIRRFANIGVNQGSDITYTDSAALGASFTINTSGVYAISHSDQASASTQAGAGISLNASSLTAPLQAIAASERLAIGGVASAGINTCAAWTGYLAAGSVIRAHTAGVGTANPAQSIFTITRVS